MFWMFGAGSLKDAVPMVEELSREGARSQVRIAAIVDALLVALGILLVRSSDGLLSGLPLLVGLVTAAPTAVFAWRRRRLESQVRDWKRASKGTLEGEAETGSVDYSAMFDGQSPSSSRDVVVIDEDGNEWSSPHATPRRADSGAGQSADARARREAEDAAQRAHDARLEEAELRDTWMPRVEAAQRAAIAAAGGTVNAPYLKDDLRVTLASYIGMLAATPVAGFFIFLAIIGLL